MALIELAASIDAVSNIVDPRLVQLNARWTMDDIVGTTLNEETGNHDGTLVNGPIQNTTDKRVGSASLEFYAGDSEYVTVPSAATFNLHATDPRTISYWFKSVNTEWTYAHFQKGVGPGGEWYCHQHLDRIYAATCRGSDGYRIALFYTPGIPLSDDTWHHVVVTWMNCKSYAEGGYIKIWIDKNETGTHYSSTTGAYVAGTEQITMGFGSSHEFLDNDYFTGKLDEVRWYEGELTQGQIDELYDIGIHNFQASIEAESLTPDIWLYGATLEIENTEQAGVADQMECNVERSLDPEIHIAGIHAVFDAAKHTDEMIEQCGIKATFQAAFEFDDTLTEVAGINDIMDAFDWARWYRENRHKAKQVFIMTLTGAADNKSDFEIPISNFNARKVSGNPTYLAVIVPSYNWLTEITDRSNGELVLDVAFYIGDSLEVREEILRVILEEIRPDEGSINRSITLSGHKTETYVNQLVTLFNSTYRSVQGGKLVHRFADIDPYINPGDNCIVGEDTLLIGSISYSVSDRLKMMEIRESD